VNLVAAELRRASAVPQRCFRSSTARSLPALVFEELLRTLVGQLRILHSGLSNITSARLQIDVDGERGAPASILSPSRTLSASTRPASSGPDENEIGLVQP